jgi:ATP-dependent Clp protease protease subunit
MTDLKKPGEEETLDKIDYVERIFIADDINQELLADVLPRIIHAQEYSHPIRVYIDSYGGDFCVGMALYHTLKGCTTETSAINMGRMFSAAFFPFMGCSVRQSLPHATILVHNMKSCGANQNTPDEMHAYLRSLDRDHSIYRNFLNELFSEAEVEQYLKESYFMSAEEARDKGIVHTITQSII